VDLASDPGDVLLTFAEIAVAFAGSASIVGIFQRGSEAGRDSFDLFRFWVMLEFSLAALFFVLLHLAGILGRSFGPYLVGLFLLLFGAGLNFVRLVWVGNPPLTR
jgi:hypothetical protein